VRILLLSMPNSFEHTPSLAIRIPNGALASLAGNLDPQHAVAIADLILVQNAVQASVERLVRDWQPDLIGLSVMTFQRGTARRIIALARALRPGVKIVVGGYDPSLAPDAYMHPALGVDAIVCGEGELTFRELVRAFDEKRELDGIAGLCFRTPDGWRRTPPRAIARLDAGEVAMPRRDARLLTGYTFLGRSIDVVETSRGCTFDCSFCSIIEMRGRNFHRFPLERVLTDIADARSRGARAVFIVDDNVTNRRILEEWLRGWQMEPTAVGDAAAALDALRRGAASGRPYALALVDASMPDAGGMELVAMMRQRKELIATRVILLTSSDPAPPGKADFRRALTSCPGLDPRGA